MVLWLGGLRACEGVRGRARACEGVFYPNPNFPKKGNRDVLFIREMKVRPYFIHIV